MLVVVLLKSVMGTPEIDDGKSAGSLERKKMDEKKSADECPPPPFLYLL